MITPRQKRKIYISNENQFNRVTMKNLISDLNLFYSKKKYDEAYSLVNEILKIKKPWTFRTYELILGFKKNLEQKLQIELNNNEEPFLTVVTVNYNNSDGLRKTVNSVLNQKNLSDIEYIIIDGASKDGSTNYLENIANDIDIVISSKDSGVYDAMNRGIQLANGQYIIFMNSGDTFHDFNVVSNIKEQFLKLKNFPSAIYGSTKLENGNIWQPHSLDGLWKGMKFSHQSVLIKTEELKKKPYDSSKMIVSDFIQLYEMYIKNNDFYNSNITISTVEDVGISSDFTGRTIERWQAVRAIKNPNVKLSDIDTFYSNLLSTADNPWTASHTLKPNKAQSNLMANTQERIVFLISMPRSGSTLLQKILEKSDQVNTLGEPWLMLPLLSGYSEDLIDAKYGQHLNILACKDFLENTKNKDIIKEAQQVYADSIYSSILRESSQRYFLDKTPRYIYIVNKLKDIYPNAKFIVLLRNPAAIISSYAHTWFNGSFDKLINDKYCRYDFEKGFESLANFANSDFKNMHLVRYEELVSKPEVILPSLFKYLKMPFQREYINYNSSSKEIKKFRFGDPKTVYSKQSPDKKHTDKWIDEIKNNNSEIEFSKVLDLVQEKTINQLGYSKDAILNKIGLNSLDKKLAIVENKFGTNDLKLNELRNKLKTNNHKKTLGVLITSYNNQDTIINAIESVVNQSKKPDLILIADDSSTDSSLEIIDDYIRKSTGVNIELVTRNENIGVSKNRDLAIRSMAVDYITTLDGDDVFYPGKLESEYLLISSNSNAVAFSDIVVETQKNIFKQDTSPFNNKTREEMVHLLCTRKAPVPRDMMFPKSLFELVGGFDHQLKAYEDWALKMRMVSTSQDFSWMSTGCIGTIYDRKSPGLSNLSNVEHVISQLLVVARNIEIFSSNRKLLSETLFNLSNQLNDKTKERFVSFALKTTELDFNRELIPKFSNFYRENIKENSIDEKFKSLWILCGN